MHRKPLGLIVACVLALSVPVAGQAPAPAQQNGGTLLTTIEGKAVDAVGSALPRVTIRLRDARYGRIVDTRQTDEGGLVTFHPSDPGTYVLELVDRNQAVLAASDIVAVAAGEAASAIVRLPSRRPQGALFNRASLLAVVGAAAATGIMARAVTGQPLSPTVVP